MTLNETGTTNENGVLFGYNGFLFLRGTKQREERVRAEFGKPFFDALTNTVQDRKARAEKLGARYIAHMNPARETFHRDHYPLDLPNFDPLIATIATSGVPNTIKAFEASPGAPFWKTDFHLSPHGGVATALDMARASGLLDEGALSFAQNSLHSLIESDDKPFIGEIGQRCSPPKSEPRRVFKPAVMISACAYDGPANFSHRHPQEGDLVVASCPEALVDKTVVVFGTSMVNALMGPLVHIFSTVIWARTAQYVYWDVVAAARADLVVSLYTGATILDMFPSDDSHCPAFMAIARETGRTLQLRNQNADVFAEALPGIMAVARNHPPAQADWKSNVIGTKAYVLDENRRQHPIAETPEIATPMPGVR